jgi:hypothetical protein
MRGKKFFADPSSFASNNAGRKHVGDTKPQMARMGTAIDDSGSGGMGMRLAFQI